VCHQRKQAWPAWPAEFISPGLTNRWGIQPKQAGYFDGLLRRGTDAAGEGADVALSLNVVAWNSAIAGSGVVGGVLLDTWGVASFAWAMLVLIGVALAIVWAARAHGFRPGRRAGVETATQ
jgi:predicted MFS family arabinose efflux permease